MCKCHINHRSSNQLVYFSIGIPPFNIHHMFIYVSIYTFIYLSLLRRSGIKSIETIKRCLNTIKAYLFIYPSIFIYIFYNHSLLKCTDIESIKRSLNTVLHLSLSIYLSISHIHTLACLDEAVLNPLNPLKAVVEAPWNPRL